MTIQCTLHILDEVNIHLKGLPPQVRRELVNSLKFRIPYAHNLPAVKLGRWDGCVSMCTSGGRTYINMLERILPLLEKRNVEFEIIDDREQHSISFPEATADMFSDVVWPEGHPKEGEPIVLNDHQVESLKHFFDNPQCIQQISTGAGKTIMTAAMSKACEHIGRTVVVVPSRDLVTQTEEDYLNLGLDVGVFYGKRKEWDKTHTICTWQSLSALDRKSKNKMTDKEISDFLDGVVAVIVDECQSAKGQVLKEMLSGPFSNCPIRWGLTGTVPKEDFESIAIVATIGPMVHQIKAAELQEKGILANCFINIKQFQEHRTFSDYAVEKSFLATDKHRLAEIAQFLDDIAESGNTLLLVRNIETGNIISDYLQTDAVFVSGSMKSADRQAEYKKINKDDGRITIATYGVASTGINIPRIFNLVLFEPGKSFITVIQSIGRGLRRAKDKDHVEIYDLCASTKYSKKHLTERKKFYKEANYDFKVTKHKYLD